METESPASDGEVGGLRRERYSGSRQDPLPHGSAKKVVLLRFLPRGFPGIMQHAFRRGLHRLGCRPETGPATPPLRAGATMPSAVRCSRALMRISEVVWPGKGFSTAWPGLAGTAWKEAVRRRNLPFLRIVVTGSLEAQDLYCEWQRVREIDEAGALLVRPLGRVEEEL